MAFHWPQRDDITIHGIGSDGGFGLRWHRLLFPMVGMPTVHFGPIAFGTPAQAVQGHAEPTMPTPIDESTPPPPGQDLSVLGATPNATDGAPTPAPQGAEATSPAEQPGAFWHPPYFLDAPLVESPAAPGDSTGDHGASAAPGDGDLSAAFLPADSGHIADLPHGLDLGFLFTPPPLPPPPDGI
jgi:hypothetical protein